MTASIDNYLPGMKGTTLANYMEFRDFIKDPEGKIQGAIIYDKLKKKEYHINSKVVVNCSGIHADVVRMKDNPKAESRMMGSRGSHLMFK